ncbi:DUF4007 family protein [Bacillus sp. ISL-35]|uniref:DUF4007 family protein n=1 Tax=Bacillus sp. ISL-35 TaxID=2819122 RepID=UPI001BE57F3A|nr:DUF4007 family protein [Bacillus sp. ISL-35]MBT2679272.1 DUF4007 family protein [Bacillus sp. ISL-35]MBT2703168.1 DUF4007 family protein [Chryseobacterium sp. ISL-80]
MGYGQHQSFYLRDRWLNKAIKHLIDDNRFFYDKSAFEKIGLGKNMVQSLRFWTVATKVVEETINQDRKKTYSITEFGEVLYKYDRYIQLNDSASIIHYHLAREKEPSTVWYWFFNILSSSVITKDELLEQFINWVKVNEEKSVSEKSLKRDIDCLINFYTAGQSADDPEEVIQSPINKVNLLDEKKGNIYKLTGDIESVGTIALMYVLLDFKEREQTNSITVEEISNKIGLWGNVFNMNRSSVIDALNKLTKHPVYPISFSRTNNLDTIKLPNVTPIDFLKYEYKKKVEILV